LVVLGITLGVAMYVATEATSQTMLSTFREMVERVSGKADLMVLGNSGGVTGSLAVELMDIEGVDHAAPGLEITTRLVIRWQIHYAPVRQRHHLEWIGLEPRLQNAVLHRHALPRSQSLRVRFGKWNDWKYAGCI
jgi:hypothetical protein